MSAALYTGMCDGQSVRSMERSVDECNRDSRVRCAIWLASVFHLNVYSSARRFLAPVLCSYCCRISARGLTTQCTRRRNDALNGSAVHGSDDGSCEEGEPARDGEDSDDAEEDVEEEDVDREGG